MSRTSRRAGQVINRGPNKWLVRVYTGRDGRGRRRYHNRTIRGPKKAADAYLTRILRETQTGVYVEPSSQLLGEFLEDWLTGTIRMTVTERTAADYRDVVRRYVLPELANHKLSQLRPGDIQNLYARLVEKGYSARTVRYVHSVLHNALDRAVSLGLIALNPASGAKLPRKRRKRDIHPLDPSELRAFLTAAAKDRHYALWVLLAATGMRPAEALGLRWQDVEGKIVHIRHNLVRLKDGSWRLKEPKTEKSRRSLEIDVEVLRVLQSHRVHQAEERLKNGLGYQDLSFVFAAANGSPLEWRIVTARHFRPIVRELGLSNTRPYDLRHTCATILLNSGVSVREVSELLGHERPSFTLDVYSHLMPGNRREALAKMASVLFA